jgi:Ca2+-transporting ATPase
MKFYRMSTEQLEQELHTSSNQGLTSQEAARILHQLGPNVLPEGREPSLLAVFISQFKNPLLYMLLLAVVLILIIGTYSDALVICGVLLFNGILGTIQEGRARNIVASLKRLVTVSAVVLRDGHHKVVEDKELVPGDLILLHEGDKIPADARIIESQGLRVNESLLTGESLEVEKQDMPINDDAPVFEQKNMVFKGTTIATGSAKAIVVATGKTTQVGQLQASLVSIEEDMPLKREIERLSYWILIMILLLCGSLLVVGLLIGRSLSELLGLLTALFIAVVPEGLPMVFTLVLASGAYRMARHHMLVKRLQAVEGLGRTDVIIIDKTGTLTRNEMVVTRAFAGDRYYDVTGSGYSTKGQVFHNGQPVTESSDQDMIFLLAEIAAALDNAEIKEVVSEKQYQVKGEPTEAALGIFAYKLGKDREVIEDVYRKRYDMPFHTGLRVHAAFYEKEDQLFLLVAGAPETVMSFSKNVTDQDKEALHRFLKQGLRVVALGYAVAPDSQPENWEKYLLENLKELQFVGIVGIQDAIRPDVAEAVHDARESGLNVVMATGDHAATARFVAEQTGIMRSGDRIIEGKTFHMLTTAEKEALDLEQLRVFARVSPQDKLELVRLWQSKNKLVAMTGDGINDVPSLMAADLGIAMGISGTDMAKDAADLVLMDDSFSSIVKAIEEGRHIFYTLRRVVLYFFSTNLSEVFVIVWSFIMQWPTPLLAPQIVWLNLVTDGFLDAALAMEPKERGLLGKSWLKRIQKVGLIDRTLLSRIIWGAVPMALGSLWIFSRLYMVDLSKARTMTLICMAMFQWFNAWNCRSERLSLAHIGFFSNIWLIAATILVAGLQVAVVYVPILQNIFKTVPLTVQEWLLCILIAGTILVTEEARKAWINRR